MLPGRIVRSCTACIAWFVFVLPCAWLLACPAVPPAHASRLLLNCVADCCPDSPAEQAGAARTCTTTRFWSSCARRGSAMCRWKSPPVSALAPSCRPFLIWKRCCGAPCCGASPFAPLPRVPCLHGSLCRRGGDTARGCLCPGLPPSRSIRHHPSEFHSDSCALVLSRCCCLSGPPTSVCRQFAEGYCGKGARCASSHLAVSLGSAVPCLVTL